MPAKKKNKASKKVSKKVTKKPAKKAKASKKTNKAKKPAKKAAKKAKKTAKKASKKATTMTTKKTAKKATAKKPAAEAPPPSNVSLHEGDAAPSFSLPGDDGQTHSLESHAGAPVVVYFYPRDDTPGCTIEACDFRDN